jgi:hypothetical protein
MDAAGKVGLAIRPALRRCPPEAFCVMTENLKLYVVGELSPDPDSWSEWGDRAIVVARDEAEAVRLATAVQG